MKCKKCNEQMVIDEWDGWKWYCVICDVYGRIATDAEIAAQEKALRAVLNAAIRRKRRRKHDSD